jgi:hypothetical protein
MQFQGAVIMPSIAESGRSLGRTQSAARTIPGDKFHQATGSRPGAPVPCTDEGDCGQGRAKDNYGDECGDEFGIVCGCT